MRVVVILVFLWLENAFWCFGVWKMRFGVLVAGKATYITIGGSSHGGAIPTACSHTQGPPGNSKPKLYISTNLYSFTEQ